jgi:hypothetical protein
MPKKFVEGKDGVTGDECQPCCNCDGAVSDYELCMILSFESDLTVDVPCGGGLISLGTAANCAAACAAANPI